jgi:peptide-methionine (S)-S-oxide reductase
MMSPATPPPPYVETITLAGGCFWCLEAVYDQIVGVTSVESGYTGGRAR